MMTRAYIAFGLSLLVIVIIAHAQDLTNQWKAFMREHNKQYANAAEESNRRRIWEENLRKIQQHNAEADRGEHTYWMSVNQYADMTDEEFDRLMNGYSNNVEQPEPEPEPEPEVANQEVERRQIPNDSDQSETKVTNHVDRRDNLPNRPGLRHEGVQAPEKDLTKQWEAFMEEYNKSYAIKREENHRRKVWEDNARKIQEHNVEADLGKHTYWLKINQYSDMTDEEFDEIMLGHTNNVELPEPEPEVDNQKEDHGRVPNRVNRDETKVNIRVVKRDTLANKSNRREKGFRALVEGLTNQWTAFMQKHNKLYANESEEEHRRKVWEENVRKIQLHNAEADKGKHTHWLKTNTYSDMTDDEFDKAMNGVRIHADALTQPKVERYDKKRRTKIGCGLPKRVDWRDRGFYTPVKNQGLCQSCYAFAALGALEAQHFKKTGRLVSLSEQNIIDCTNNTDYNNNGCKGGSIENTYMYIMNNGVDTDTSYPYVGKVLLLRDLRYHPGGTHERLAGVDKRKVGHCSFTKATVGSTLKDFGNVLPANECKLKKVVYWRGPVAAEMDGSGKFRHYGRGVYTNDTCSTKSLNHATVVVGYGGAPKRKYWILKNSYGKSWGMCGYMHLARGKKNMCGIASKAVYPIV